MFSGKTDKREMEIKEDASLPLSVWKEAPSFFLLKPPSLFLGKRHAGGCFLLLPASSQALSQKARMLKTVKYLSLLSIIVYSLEQPYQIASQDFKL